MGQDKLRLDVGNITLLDRVYCALAVHCEEILLVGARGETPPGTRLVDDLRAGEGPLAGIEAGLLAASHPSLFVAAGDLPFLTGGFVGHLLGLLSERTPAVVPAFGGRKHPLCAVYRREVRPVVSAALDRGIRSVHELLEGLPGVRYVGEEELRRFGDPNLLLMNVNSPEDLASARAALREDVKYCEG